MSNRTHAQAFADDDLLHIELGGEAEQIQADRVLCRMFSTCARGLPADAEEWDLSNILIDGQPVTRRVVVAWLNRAYMCSYAEQFEEQQDDPAVSMEGLYQLLAFADAIGTTKPVLQACVSQLDQLELHVQLGEQQLQLATDGRMYFLGKQEPMQLIKATPSGSQRIAEPAGSKEEKQAFLNQVQQQTEQLLFMAYKLQLAPLLDRLHTFVRSQVFGPRSVLPQSSLGNIFSRRVLDAALGPNQLGKEAWLHSVLSEPCGLTAGSGKQQLFKPIGLTEQQKQPIEFQAELLRDFMGVAKGTTVPVRVKLFEGKIDIGSIENYKADLALMVAKCAGHVLCAYKLYAVVYAFAGVTDMHV